MSGNLLRTTMELGGLEAPMVVVVGLVRNDGAHLPMPSADGVMGLLPGCDGVPHCWVAARGLRCVALHFDRMELALGPRPCPPASGFVHGAPGSGQPCAQHAGRPNRAWMRLHRLVVDAQGLECGPVELADVWVMFDTAMTHAVSFHHGNFEVDCDQERPITSVALQQVAGGPTYHVPLDAGTAYPSCLPTCQSLDQAFRRGWLVSLLRRPPFVMLGLQFLVNTRSLRYTLCPRGVESVTIEFN
jgi:hypothetical protein